LKIALDATYSVGENLSGVGVYSRQMLSRLPARDPDSHWLFCFRPHRFLRSFELDPPHNAGRRPLLERFGPRSTDLFHGLNQRMPAWRSRRTVCTFHDLFVLSEEYSTADFRRRFALQARQAAERSDLIIAVSEFTARQAEDLLGVERERLRVVHHGVTIAGADPGMQREKMILSVGALQRRKNTTGLVAAFERIPAGWTLVLAGSLGFGGEQILRRIEQSPRRADIQVRGYVSRRELEGLYARAGIFAFPSLGEGFGMPVIDAMAAGVPVVSSNRTALAEVAGEAALLVDPTDTDAIASALSRLIEDESLRAEMIRRGGERAKGFSWEKAAMETWRVYEELLC